MGLIKKKFLLLAGTIFLVAGCSSEVNRVEISNEDFNASINYLYERNTDGSKAYINFINELKSEGEYVDEEYRQTLTPIGTHPTEDIGGKDKDDIVVVVGSSLGGTVTYEPEENIPRQGRGLYTFKLEYYIPETFVSNGLIEITINGQKQFEEASSINLPLVYEDVVEYNEDGTKNFDTYVNRYGDQMFPKQKRVVEWQVSDLNSTTYDTADPLIFDLSTASLKIVIKNLSEREIYLGNLEIVPYQPLRDYITYKSTVGSELGQGSYELNATEYVTKNTNEVRLSNEMTPTVSPYNYDRKLLNVLTGWSVAGQEVTWKINVKEAGLYPITLHYYNGNNDFPVYRSVYINGEIPFREFQNYEFPTTGNGYKNVTLSDADGNPYMYYFEANKDYYITLRAEVEITSVSYANLMSIYNDINDFAIQIRKITGSNVDANRNWKLTEYYPEIVDILDAYRNILYYEYNRLLEISNNEKKSGVLIYFPRILGLIDDFVENPDEIPLNLTKFSSGDSCLAKLIADTANTLKTSSMTLDTIYVTNNQKDIRSDNASFFEKAWESIKTLFSTFSSDRYNSEFDPDALNIWVNRALTYIDIMQTMADNYFTPKTGIKVNIRQMPGEQNLILANAANNTPDLALGINSGLPFEFALRGDAAYPMSDFDDFWEYASQVPAGQLMTFLYQDKFYGLPETSTSEVMFARSDILNVLGDNNTALELPKTWDDLIGILPRLQNFGMNFYYPASASGSLKSLASTTQLILQYGGNLTNFSNNTFTMDLRNLNTIEGLSTLTDLYTIYALPTEVASFYNSFRYGSIPIGIGDINMYLQLKYVAPELAGKWEVSLAPGVRQTCSLNGEACPDLNYDGKGDEISRWYISNGTGSMIFKKSKKINEAWEFYKWWMSTDIQLEYAETLQATFGPSFVWFSANKEAAQSLLIDEEVREIFLEAQTWIRDLQQIPGQYMLQRGLSDIWNKAVIDGMSVENAIDITKVVMDREIQRKLEEFGYYDSSTGQMIKPYIMRSYDWVNQCVNNYKNGITTGNPNVSYCPL